MENKKTKFNKTKLIARVMLVVLLLSSALNFCSCDMKYKYILSSSRYAHQGNYSPSHFVATSNTTVFDINDITFNIAYATHQIQKKNPKSSYPNVYGDNPILYFGLYICPYETTSEEFWNFENQTYNDVDSFQNIEGYKFVNGITDEEAFTKEYALISTPFFISNGSIYNHVESITIPKEYITGDQGAFMLKFICFIYSEYIEGYRCLFVKGITFYYDKIDENIVKINFERYNFMCDEL